MGNQHTRKAWAPTNQEFTQWLVAATANLWYGSQTLERARDYNFLKEKLAKLSEKSYIQAQKLSDGCQVSSWAYLCKSLPVSSQAIKTERCSSLSKCTKHSRERKKNTGSEREKGPIKGIKWINRKETNIYGLPDKFKIIILKKLKVLQENTLKTTKQN